MITRVWNESCLGGWQRAAHEIYRVKPQEIKIMMITLITMMKMMMTIVKMVTRLRLLYPTFFYWPFRAVATPYPQ